VVPSVTCGAVAFWSFVWIAAAIPFAILIGRMFAFGRGDVDDDESDR